MVDKEMRSVKESACVVDTVLFVVLKFMDNTL